VRLYLDSATTIYAVEQVAPYAAVVDARLADPDLVIVTSELTRLECRVKPLRDGNSELLEDFDDYFEDVIEIIVPLSREVVDAATGIRARYGFKVPDAVHLAAAVQSRCEVFLTNDHRLRRFAEIAIEVVEPQGLRT
jgi:predicted nucleic acid-binding protein